MTKVKKISALLLMVISQNISAVELLKNTDILDPTSLNISANIYPKQECEINAEIKDIGELNSGEENTREYPINISCTGFGTYELTIGEPTETEHKISGNLIRVSGLEISDSPDCGLGKDIFNSKNECVFYGKSNGTVDTITLELKIKTETVNKAKSFDFNIPISMKTKI